MSCHVWCVELQKKKPKLSRARQLDINPLADLGPQWWSLRIHSSRAPDIAAALVRTLPAAFPQFEFEVSIRLFLRPYLSIHPSISITSISNFQVYNPCTLHRRRLKNGSISVKNKPLAPGIIYLRCILNRDIYDFVRDQEGVNGFFGPRITIR